MENEQNERDAARDLYQGVGKLDLDYKAFCEREQVKGLWGVYSEAHGDGFRAGYDAGRASAAEQLTAAEKVNKYALATLRALDQYTFEDSDHGLLITAAVTKLEALTAPYTEKENEK